MYLVEICNSTYKHLPIEIFGKKYYKRTNSDRIICAECIDAYIDTFSKKMTDIIIKCLDSATIDVEMGDDRFTFTENISVADYMQYSLPVKFSIEINMTRIPTVNISSISCPDTMPKFDISFSISDDDRSREYINSTISKYISWYIIILYDEIPDDAVKIMMKNASASLYTSTCICNDSGSSNTASSIQVCKTCNSSTSYEKYIYNNNQYCLDCMYNIIVDLAVANNVTDEVGLSIDKQSLSYSIVNTAEWKRSVISKYINIMMAHNIDPNIIHYTMTIMG